MAPIHCSLRMNSIQTVFDLSEQQNAGLGQDCHRDSLFEDAYEGDLEVGYNDDPEERESTGFFISMRGSRLLNEKSGRTFGCGFECVLERAEMENLHAFLETLVKLLKLPKATEADLK